MRSDMDLPPLEGTGRRERAHQFALAVMRDAAEAGLSVEAAPEVVQTIARLAWDLVDAMDGEEQQRRNEGSR